MPHADILIVGAGPTGLVLALNLARRGVRFRIIDRKKGPSRESRAMGVQARTLEFYDQLGFADEVVARGVKAGTVHFREGGTEIARFSLSDMGEGLSPYPFLLSFPQDEHERLLIEKLEAAGAAVEWGVELVALDPGENDVRATLSRAGQQEACRVAYVCGCDGARSRVRESVGIGFSGGTYDQLFYVADVRVEGAENADIYANLGAHSIALMMPVRTTGMQRLIGIVPPRLKGRRDLTYADIQPAVEPLLGTRVAEVNWFSTYHVHHRVADRFRVGRCFIAGDAGHIHSPTGGQGMNTGVGDAVNLAWKLADVTRGRAAPSLLDSYEAERIAFARSLVATTDKAFQRMVAEGRSAQLLRTWVAPYALAFVAGFSAARRAMFRTVSQIRISYPESDLSEGEAGGVAGGDRLPWARDAAGDNFTPLRLLDWQLHVYGRADEAFAREVGALGLSLHVAAWSQAADDAGFKENAAYLVRPDGYVALAMPRQDARRLRAHASRHGLTFSRVTARPPMAYAAP